MGEGERSLGAGTVAGEHVALKNKRRREAVRQRGTRGYESADEPNGHENTRHSGGEPSGHRLLAILAHANELKESISPPATTPVP